MPTMWINPILNTKYDKNIFINALNKLIDSEKLRQRYPDCEFCAQSSLNELEKYKKKCLDILGPVCDKIEFRIELLPDSNWNWIRSSI